MNQKKHYTADSFQTAKPAQKKLTITQNVTLKDVLPNLPANLRKTESNKTPRLGHGQRSMTTEEFKSRSADYESVIMISDCANK